MCAAANPQTELTPTRQSRYRFVDEKGEHLHTLDERPLIGTTNVMNILAKPLAWYGSGRAVMEFGVPDPKVLTKIRNGKATEEERLTLNDALDLKWKEIHDMQACEYVDLVMRAYRAHDTYKNQTAKTGVDLHAECERFVTDCILNNRRFLDDDVNSWDWPLSASVIQFLYWSAQHVDKFLWSEGHCYSEKHWLGGISDCGVVTKDGKRGIIDFKSSKEAYLSQFWQCAGYAIQAEETGVHDKNGQRILPPQEPFDFVGVFPFGAAKPVIQTNVDVPTCKKGFLAALEIYKLLPKD